MIKPPNSMSVAGIPSLTGNMAYHSGSRGLNRLWADPTGAMTSAKRADSQNIHWGMIIDWVSKFNVGVANTSVGAQAGDVSVLNKTGFDAFRSGGDFFIPYVGTQGYYVFDVYGRTAYLGGSPNLGIQTAVDGPADVGVNMQSEIQHTYTQKFFKKNAQTGMQRSGLPVEMLTGDYVQLTPEGNYIGCYRGGLNLFGSSQWAEIMSSRIDHLIRIRSRTFEHFDSLGERRSYNDEGELTQEVLLTDDQAESFGKKREKYEDVTDTEEDNTNGRSYRKLLEPGATGNWRLRMHVGYLGDMLHIVFTQPFDGQKLTVPRPNDPGVNAPYSDGQEDTEPATGVAEVYIGSDGSVISRSTKDLISEKVGHIRVPLKKREANDPDGDTTKDKYTRAKRIPFVWDTENLAGRHLQENEFREWEVDHTEMYRTRGHTKDWAVKQRKDSRCPKAEDGVEQYEPGISVIHQRNDGSVYIQDHWASTIQMIDGDIIIAPTRDLMLQPGRDIAMITPRDTVIRAKKYVDITSSEKDVRIKAQLSMFLYAKYSGILIETSASKSKNPAPEDTDPNYTDPVKGVKLDGDDCTYDYSVGGTGGSGSASSTRYPGIRLHLRESESSVEVHSEKEECPVIIQTDGISSPVAVRTTKQSSPIRVTTDSVNSIISVESAGQLQLESTQDDIIIDSARHIVNLAVGVFGVRSNDTEMTANTTHIYAQNEQDVIQHLHVESSTEPSERPTSVDGFPQHRHIAYYKHQHRMFAGANPPSIRPTNLFGPYLKLLDFKFDYRDYDIGKKIYQTYWQFVKSGDNTWKQKSSDEVVENVYPGKDFNLTEYTPGTITIESDPKGDKYVKGTFADKSPNYPLVDLSKEYSEDSGK